MKLYLNLPSTAFNLIKNVKHHFETNRVLDLKKFVPFLTQKYNKNLTFLQKWNNFDCIFVLSNDNFSMYFSHIKLDKNRSSGPIFKI